MFSYGPNNEFKQFVILGRPVPKNPAEQTPIYRMKIFAKNSVVAKARFWFFMNKLRKLKKTRGQLLVCKQIVEEDQSNVKNYQIWIRYNSKTGIHNMVKEYRDVSICGAVKQMYTEMASRHKATFYNIQIIKTLIVEDKDVRRTNTIQFLGDNVKFPLIRRLKKLDKQDQTIFSAKRPKLVGW